MPLFTFIGFIKFLSFINSQELLATSIILLSLAQVENIIHNYIHTRGSFLENCQWFIYLRKVHYLHHSGTMKRNYALVAIWIDVLLNTFEDPI